MLITQYTFRQFLSWYQSFKSLFLFATVFFTFSVAVTNKSLSLYSLRFSFFDPHTLGSFSSHIFRLIPAMMSSSATSTGVIVLAPVSTISTSSTNELPPIHSVYRLDGKNYLKWSQLVRMYLKGRGKLNHLLATCPTQGDPKSKPGIMKTH